MGYKIYLNITCPNKRCYGKYGRSSSLIRNLLNVKFNVFKIPDNKNIGKLFSKYEMLYLDQANSSSDPSQILILQFPTPRASLSPSSSLSNFTLVS